MQERYIKMYNLRKDGKTYKHIASKFGITHQGVQFILKNNFPIIKIVRIKKFSQANCRNCDRIFTYYDYGGRGIFCSKKCHNEYWKYLKKTKYTSEYFTDRNRVRVKNYYNTEKGKNIIRKLQKKSYAKYKFKASARSKLNFAIQKGEIIKPKKCSICSKSENIRIEGHHEDYSKPLEVIWVCTKCHYQLDKKLRLQ